MPHYMTCYLKYMILILRFIKYNIVKYNAKLFSTFSILNIILNKIM